MSGKGRLAEKAPNLGEFRFIGGGDGDHEGSLAFSDISFPSHVSDLESFHSDLDVSINSVQSRESMSAADDDRESSREQLERRSQSGGDNRESFGKLPDLPEKASENVDVLLAALKAATLQDSSSERSIDSNKSESSNSNQDSTRFISRESFPESVLAEASQSWVKESGHLGEGMPADKPPSAGSGERDTSLVKPSSDSRLSEKFLAPSKTPDNGRGGYFGADKSDRSPWSFSGDSLWFQTPTPARPGDSVVVAKNDSLSKQLSGAKAKPSSSSTPVEENPSNKSLNQSNQFPARASISNDTFPPQKDRLSEMDFSVAAYNPFDASYDNAGVSGGLSTKPSSERNTKPSSSSTPVGLCPSEQLRGQSSQLKSNLVKPSISKDVFPSQQDAMSNMNFSTAAYNPFDGSPMDQASNAQGMEIGSSMFGDGDGFVGDDAQDGFSFQTADDAAKRLDQDEKIFEENHRFDKEDAMIDVAGKSFSYYILPGESSHRSPSIIGVNDPNDKGEVRISFGEFFAAKTGELGRLSDVNEDRPRPQFSDTRDCKVSPTAIPPRQLYRPSSPEGSERDTSYQPSFADLDKDPRKWTRSDQSQAKEHVAMAARSLPCGAEADDEKGRGTREGEGAAERKSSRKEDKTSTKDKECGAKRSEASSKELQKQLQTGDCQEESRRNSGGLELNDSTLAALKFCKSSEGSKLSAMSSNELKSLSKTLARANIDDAQEIYKVLVNFINSKGIPPEEVVTSTHHSPEIRGDGHGGVGQAGGSQEGDTITFYHSDTSCEVSPTDPKFRTMSSISSPPLDTSSPKSSGSSIGVQTESRSAQEVTTVHTSCTTSVVTSNLREGVPVGTHLPVCSSAADGVFETRTNELVSSKQHGGTPVVCTSSPVTSKHYASIRSQTTSTATSPVSPMQYSKPSPTNPPDDANVIPTTSVARTLTPDPYNYPTRISPGAAPYGSQQPVSAASASAILTERQKFEADIRPFSDPKATSSMPYHPEVPRYQHQERFHPISQPGNQGSRVGDPYSIPRFPVETTRHASGQQYYQLESVPMDPRTGRVISGTSRTVAASTSSGDLPAQVHALRHSAHANAVADHAFARSRICEVNTNSEAGYTAVPVSSHAFPVDEHVGAEPKHVIPIPSHAFTRTDAAKVAVDHASTMPARAIGGQSREIPVSRHADFRSIRTESAFSGYTRDILAQSCPTSSAPAFASPKENAEFALRALQPVAPSEYGGHRTQPHVRQAVQYQDGHIPSQFLGAQPPLSAPLSTKNAFSYQDVGQEKYSVVGGDCNRDDKHVRRPHGSSGAVHRQGEVWNSRTERSSQIQMVVPPVLDFPGVLCVGTSAEASLSIYNPTSRWIRCSSEIVTCTINGFKVDYQECPFSIREKTMIGPKLTENIKVDFKCLSAGVYVAEMKVVSTPVASASGDIETSSAFVSLQGFAEEPKIEIIADELRTLDFGEIHHGCKSVKPLRIMNKGMTVVPLKMRICSNSSPGMFIFSKANTPEVIPELDLQNTTLKCLVPARNDSGIKPEPLVIWIELADKNQHFEKSDEAEVLSAGINIQLDVGTVAKILGNIQLSAILGFTKIQIPKAFQMAMCLSSPVGKRVSREFPFTNAGNICANVELTVPKHLDVFSVTPEKFQVRPGMAVMVKVMFTPLCKETCETVIQVLEPDNSKCYEVLLRGSAVEPQPEIDDVPPILSNKSWLCWTGVDLGNATHQRLFLLNDSADQPIHFQAMIQGEHSDFEIQRMRSEFSKGGVSSEKMVLRPKERMPIYVLFAPSSFGVFKSALVLKPDRGPRFQIPLYAYGGKSCLSFVDLKKTAEGFDAPLGEVSLGRRNILKITVRNTGNRAAFVKAVCFADFQIRLHYHQTHLSIVPSEFVLPERSSKELVIVYQPLQHDAKACQYESKRVATVVFYHGDEVLRQWYRKNLSKQKGMNEKHASGNWRNDDIQFDKIFQDENCTAEDFDFPDLDNYERIFDSHVSQTFVNLLGGSEKNVVQSDMGEESLVMATPRKRCLEPETEKSTVAKGDIVTDKRTGNTDKDESSVWSLIPEQISLKVPVKGSSDSTKKIQLLNFSDRQLEFELIWPAHCIAVTPHTGAIARKSQTTINISAWGSILKSGVDLPWSGTAYVKCDGEKKAIAIQIHNPLVSDNSPAPSVIDKPLSIVKSGKDEPRLSQTYTAFVKPLKATQLLKIIPTLIDFDEIQVNKASCSTVTIENISTSSLRWKISSFAPAYAKVSDASAELLRATYPVFSFSTQSGFLRANQIVKIQVEFRARDAGDYCQIWDCQTNPESPLTSTKIKLELSGKAVVNDRTSSAEMEKDKKSVEKGNVGTSRESLPEIPSKETKESQKGKAVVYFQSDNVDFPDTKVGQTSTARIKICNKSTSEQQFRIIASSAPFYMKCTSLVTKPSHYLKIPVYFSPQEAGKHYEATVAFENIKSGETLDVKLRANSV